MLRGHVLLPVPLDDKTINPLRPVVRLFACKPIKTACVLKIDKRNLGKI
jgi:hypothetical protein